MTTVWILIIGVLITVDCGGGAQKGIRTGSDVEPLEFTLKVPDRDLHFEAFQKDTYEYRGTSHQWSYHYFWDAQNWLQDGESGVCEVTLRDIDVSINNAFSMESKPLEDFAELEGDTRNYILDDEGFRLENEIGKFMGYKARYRILAMVMMALDVKLLETPIACGGSWVTEFKRRIEVDQSTYVDPTITHTYIGETVYEGRKCAVIESSFDFTVDGPTSVFIISEKKTYHNYADGRMFGETTSYYDRDMGFYPFIEGNVTLRVKLRASEGKHATVQSRFSRENRFLVKLKNR